MALEYLDDTPQRAFRKLEADLRLVNPEVNLRPYKNMTPRSLEEEIDKLESVEKKIIHEQTYGSWLVDDRYVEHKLLKEALSFLKEYKEGRRQNEVLVPGFTYYRHVKQFGNELTGHRCYFREGAEPHWVPFKQPVAVMKAFEVLRHGSDNDFRKIYIEMADGRVNALQKVSLEHITESTPEALKEIEKYCDSRWSGPWAWETPSPYKLREKIEEIEQMRHRAIVEMQGQFENLLVKLNEEDMDKYEVIASAEEMSKKIEGMVAEIARLAGEGIIKLKDQIRVAMGDEAAESIEDSFVAPVREAADSLSKLRATIDQTVEKLKAGDVSGMPGAELGGDLGGDLGTPEDALNGDLRGEDDELAGDLADVSVDGVGGDEGERPRKEM